MKRRKYFYVEEENQFMQVAKELAKTRSLDPDWPTGGVLVSTRGRSSSGRKDGQVIGGGWNGSEYHLQFGCERKRLGIKTGERYDLCEGCDPKNHSEPRAIADAKNKGHDCNNADLYMWGHWWCCEPCWQALIDAGVKKVYLMKGANRKFKR